MTTERILKDQNTAFYIMLNLLFMLVGVATVIAVVKEGGEPGYIIFQVIFTVLMLGIVPLIIIQEKLKSVKKIKDNNIFIVEDTVAYRHSDGNCLVFDMYTRDTEKFIQVKRSIYACTKVGDEFYLVYAENKRTPIGKYPKKDYSLSSELKNRLR